MIRVRPVSLTLFFARWIPFQRWSALLAVGGLSLLIYWIGLILRYNLFTLNLQPLLDIAKLTRHQPVAQAGYILIFITLFGLYILAWQLCRPTEAKQPRAMWFALGVSLTLITFSVLWLYPIGAVDIFDYIARGRITAFHGGNPFAAVPRAYPQDPFRPYEGWHGLTSTYGPLWELLAAATSRIAGNGILANVLGFKLLNLIFYAGSTVLIAVILNRCAPERALQGVCMFAWNPLVIYEIIGNGHNDIVMIFFILLGVYAILTGHFSWAMLALTAGGLIKFIPFILLPLAWMAGLGAHSSRLQRWRFSLATGMACAGLALAVFAPFLNSWETLRLMPTLTSMFTTSLPAFIQAQLEPSLGISASQIVVAYAAYAILAMMIVFQMRRIWVEILSSGGAADPTPVAQGNLWPGGLVFIRAALLALLFYVLFASPWFQPWYALWPLALAVLLPEGPLSWTAVLLSYIVLWKTPLFDFLLFPGDKLPPQAWRETLLGPANLGIVWLYIGARVIHDRIKGRSI